MPQLEPSRAAASLQQDMDQESSVGVCAHVSLPYCFELDVRTKSIWQCKRCHTVSGNQTGDKLANSSH